MATAQKESYDREKAKFEKDLKGWEERKKAWDAQQPAYRGKPFPNPVRRSLASLPSITWRLTRSRLAGMPSRCGRTPRLRMCPPTSR